MNTFNDKQTEALNLFKNKKSFFLSGPAGVGKSFFIKHIKKWSENNNYSTQITAMTGAAALLINGKTLHSWAGIGLGNEDADYLARKVKSSFPAKLRWRKVRALVIDEVSMLSPELFDKLEHIAREVRNNSEYFGGIQLILSGDFYQLPPIMKDQSQSQSKKKLFCFESPVWKKLMKTTVELDDIIRQSDPVFQNILNEIRIGQCSDESIKILKSRIGLKFSNKDGIEPTKLLTRRYDVDSINNKKLETLKNDIKTFSATMQIDYASSESENDTKKFSKKELERIIQVMDKDASYLPELKLSIGAQVMLITNKDFKAGLVNGSRGIITSFNARGLPVVRFVNNLEIPIDYHSWELMDKKGIVIRKQLPLKLAWAITVHKSQGASLDLVEVDIGSNIFEFGQTYVSLSRVRSLQGLYIKSFDPSKIKAHPRVIDFYENQQNQDDDDAFNEVIPNSIDKFLKFSKK